MHLSHNKINSYSYKPNGLVAETSQRFVDLDGQES